MSAKITFNQFEDDKSSDTEVSGEGDNFEERNPGFESIFSQMETQTHISTQDTTTVQHIDHSLNKQMKVGQQVNELQQVNKEPQQNRGNNGSNHQYDKDQLIMWASELELNTIDVQEKSTNLSAKLEKESKKFCEITTKINKSMELLDKKITQLNGIYRSMEKRSLKTNDATTSSLDTKLERIIKILSNKKFNAIKKRAKRRASRRTMRKPIKGKRLLMPQREAWIYIKSFTQM